MTDRLDSTAWREAHRARAAAFGEKAVNALGKWAHHPPGGAGECSPITNHNPQPLKDAVLGPMDLCSKYARLPESKTPEQP